MILIFRIAREFFKVAKMKPETQVTLADLVKCFPKDVSDRYPEKIEYPVVLYQDHSETIR